MTEREDDHDDPDEIEENNARENENGEENDDGEEPAVHATRNGQYPEFPEDDRENFKKLLSGQYTEEGTYVTDISKIIEDIPEKVRTKSNFCRSVIISTEKLITWFPQLRLKLKNFPSFMIEKMTEVLEEVIAERHGNDILEEGKFHLRPGVEKLAGNNSGFDDTDSSHIGKLITMRGVVTAITNKKPCPTIMVFKCPKCSQTYEHHVDENLSVYYPPPKYCTNIECAATGKTKWIVDPFKTRYVDFRKITIQEEPEHMKTRQQPRSISVVVMDDIADVAKPGSRVMLNGMLLATPEFNEEKKQWDYGLFSMHVYCFNVETEDSEEKENERITEEREREIMNFVMEKSRSTEEYFDFLASSVAPMIDGYREIKISLLCSVVGGQLYVPERNMKVNPYVHVLLVGDPGTAKTMMIESIRTLATRFEYASGQGASGRGLTAAVVAEDGEPYLQAGAVVLADGGICAVDEFEKIKKEDRSALHEQMEHGRVTVRRWKFQETLMARTTIIAAANPKKGRIVKPEEGMSIQENLSEIPLPIQSRFAMIFLIEDVPEMEKDRSMVRKMRSARSVEYARPMYDQSFEQVNDDSDVQKKVDFVRDLCVLAKRHADDLVRKKEGIGVTDEAEKLLESFYLQTRAKCLDDDGEKKTNLPIQITARQYGSIDKVSTALAKLTFSKDVEKRHVEIAIKLVELSMKQTLMDEDGNIDAGMGVTGKSQTRFDKRDSFLRALESMEKEEKEMDPKSQGANLEQFKERMMTHFNITEEDFESIQVRMIGEHDSPIKLFAGNKRIRLTPNGKDYIK
jgi:replicative DNA helicase Mcm